ncbi:uncharacterized protein LOC112604080 [Melanaphis sacchari]|uniref:uncharacterized protein LOC112604080 n=1 Tax=Melanaphis sacchari TaxID=742174 RepID=UPI000DC14861|nr:uncharacterized protein LOC112604080 [Melanaphis sacchari]
MAISILESDRIDRYELEIFIGQVNFTEFKFKESENCNANDKAGLKQEELSKQKYTIKTMLDNIIEYNISNYDNVNEDPEDQCLTYYDDLKSNESLQNIVKQLSERYNVNMKPNCNVQNICFDIMYKESDKVVISTKPTTINRGLICIFACVPRTLVTILQKNPLELIIYEDLEDDRIKLGSVSIMLSSSMGFTSAISYHFYEKGYDIHAHTVESVHEVKNMDGSQSIGDMFVRLKLTCHGPETMQVNQIVLKSDQPELQPIFNDNNSFDFYFDKNIMPSPPRMMYGGVSKCEDKVLNPEIKELLDCQRIQETKEDKPCICPFKGLLENIQTILSSDIKQCASICKLNLAVNEVCNDEICRSVTSAEIKNNDCMERKSK